MAMWCGNADMFDMSRSNSNPGTTTVVVVYYVQYKEFTVLYLYFVQRKGVEMSKYVRHCTVLNNKTVRQWPIQIELQYFRM